MFGDRSSLILDLLDIKYDSFGEKRTRLLKELQLAQELDNQKEDMLFLKELVGTFEINGGKLSGINILKKNVIENMILEKEGTLSEKGGKLLIKKGRMLLKVLLGLIEEMTLEEAQRFAGFESKETFREDYLNVLRKNGLIDQTISNKHDPNQRYKITEKGKKLIGGFEIQ